MYPWLSLSPLDALLFDMDGTLLDLHFDNHFWLEHLPLRWGEKNQIPLPQAKQQLSEDYRHLRGKLAWYCLDHWEAHLGLDILALKQEVAHLIGIHPGVQQFLTQMRAKGKQCLLVTNAHRGSVNLKMAQTGLDAYLDGIVSSHDYGHPKEDQAFWTAFFEAHPRLRPAHCLFVDDNLEVLASARQAGVGHLLAISQPDSRQGPKDTTPFPSVRDFSEWLDRLYAEA